MLCLTEIIDEKGIKETADISAWRVLRYSLREKIQALVRKRATAELTMLIVFCSVIHSTLFKLLIMAKCLFYVALS